MDKVLPDSFALPLLATLKAEDEAKLAKHKADREADHKARDICTLCDGEKEIYTHDGGEEGYLGWQKCPRCNATGRYVPPETRLSA